MLLLKYKKKKLYNLLLKYHLYILIYYVYSGFQPRSSLFAHYGDRWTCYAGTGQVRANSSFSACMRNIIKGGIHSIQSVQCVEGNQSDMTNKILRGLGSISDTCIYVQLLCEACILYLLNFVFVSYIFFDVPNRHDR